MSKRVVEIHQKYIINTPKDALVHERSVLVCSLTHAVAKGIELEEHYKVYINSKALKHCYDKRPAFEYDMIINRMFKIIKHPEEIYKNKPGKRGDYCFVKTINNQRCLCVVEIDNERLDIVTFYRVPKEKYLDSFSLMWSWRDDKTPHRSTFDSDQGQPTNAPQ